ncbi:hypothetical protein BJY04DRAFT_225106 [Aspergillus karnatakaensis]|uniref:uncharacterized protein n=1 Tax=Aspergillus karnatakaensis TaxID=1810916 RepID=UPI003CCE072D
MDKRPLRSCTVCRTRKVKCDRQQPCGNCNRGKCTCVYPEGTGRAPKQPRRSVETRLLAQLVKLENVVKQMQAGGATAPNSVDDMGGGEGQKKGKEWEIDSEEPSGRLLVDDMQSCYLNSRPWATLGEEIEGIRELLNDYAADTDDEDSAPPEGFGTNAAIWGFRALAHSLRVYHPPAPQAAALYEVFKTNVSPMVRMFHTPTLDRIFWDAAAAMGDVDKNVEALLFAIYYSAVMSLRPEQCLSLLGVSRAWALETYRFSVEQAMARADLLNTHNLVLVQAAVLFLNALHNEDDSRTVWSLTALLYHIAQAMGLHRDGEAFGLRPLETEMRRRAWWSICLMDIRSAHYLGREPIVHEHIFDTKTPLNILDTDLTAEMTQAPSERQEPTDMIFFFLHCDLVRLAWKIENNSKVTGRRAEGNSKRLSPTDKLSMMEEFQDNLQDRYIKPCDKNIPILRLCSMIAQMIILRLRIIASSPRIHNDRSARDRVFQDSVEVTKIFASTFNDPELNKWTWYGETQIQWHCVAFVLAEFCWRLPSEECDSAWESVTTMCARTRLRSAGQKGLWRPIQRLLERARRVREAQNTGNQHPETENMTWIGGGLASSEDNGQLPSLAGQAGMVPPASYWGDIRQTSTAAAVDFWVKMLPPSPADILGTSMMDLGNYAPSHRAGYNVSGASGGSGSTPTESYDSSAYTEWKGKMDADGSSYNLYNP